MKKELPELRAEMAAVIALFEQLNSHWNEDLADGTVLFFKSVRRHVDELCVIVEPQKKEVSNV